MSRNFVNASSQYLFRNSFAIATTGGPRTVNIWCRTASTSNPIITHAKTTGFGGVGHMSMVIDGSGNLAFEVYDGSVTASCTTTSGATANVWFMATMVLVGSSDHRVFINGGSRGTDASSVAIRNYNRLYIGTDDTPTDYWDGQLAEVAVWTSALSDTQIAELYESRCQALYVAPDFLACYMSMTDDADYAEFGTLAAGGAGTRLDFQSSGSPTVSEEHPPIVRQAGALF